MKKAVKVLLIGHMPPPSGGVSVHLQRLLTAAKIEKDISLAVFDLRKRRIFYGGHSKGIINASFYFLSSHIVHLHISHRIKITIARLCRLLGKKIFYTRHNPREAGSAESLKMYSLSDVIISVSETKEIPPAENVHIIPAYIPALATGDIDEKLKAVIAQYEKTVVCISTHSQNKAALAEGKDLYGFDLAIGAMKLISSGGKILLLLIDPSAAWRNKYHPGKILPLSTGVDVLYFTHEQDFQSMLPHVSVFLRPTRSDGDAISIREALDYGVTVVASDSAPRPEGVLVYPAENAAVLSQTIVKALGFAAVMYRQPSFAKNIFQLYRNA